VSRAISLTTGHPRRNEGSFSHGASSPLRVRQHLPTGRPVGRLLLPGFRFPSTVPGRAPQRTGCQTCPGSALRLSQPLSGFLASPGFAALFRAATVREIYSFRAFPSRESRTPLGAVCSLAVIHQRSWTNSPSPYPRPFHRRPRFHAVAWIPGRLWLPFPRILQALPRTEARFYTLRLRFPVGLGLEQRNRPAPPTSPASKP